MVLLDLQMPVMTGEEFLDELSREFNPEIASTPIVIITASAVPIQRKVAGYLRKPLDLDLLVKTLLQLIL